MSDFDPKHMDRGNSLGDSRYQQPGDFNWNWVIAGIAAIVVLLVAMSFIDRSSERMAENPAISTTGQGTPEIARDAPVTTRPSSPAQ